MLSEKRNPTDEDAPRTPEEVERHIFCKKMDELAIEAAGNLPDWKPYLYEAVDGVGIQVTGCKTRPLKSGPNKGKPKYLTKEQKITVLLKHDVLEQARKEATAAAGRA